MHPLRALREAFTRLPVVRTQTRFGPAVSVSWARRRVRTGRRDAQARRGVGDAGALV
jgi:hypothetical protein